MVIAVVVFIEAIKRFGNVGEIHTGLMLGAAIAGGAANLVCLMIIPRAWNLLREVIDVLLETTPKNIDLDQLREHIMSVDGVVDAHDIHVWTITSGVPVFSAHVVVEDDTLTAEGMDAVLDRLIHCLSTTKPLAA